MNHFSLFGSLSIYIENVQLTIQSARVGCVWWTEGSLYMPVQGWLGTPSGQEHMHVRLNFLTLLCAH